MANSPGYLHDGADISQTGNSGGGANMIGTMEETKISFDILN